MSAANPDHFDSLSSHNRPFSSGPSLAPFQPDPRATLSWQPYRVDTPTTLSGTNPNQLESLSFSDHQFASRPVSAPFQSDVMASDIYSSNNVRTSYVTISANPKGSISKRDWNEHRALITKLYAKQTLPEVMKFMEINYDFRATVKMYKMRIKQWGLDKKNNKENEMRAIVHKNKQRSDQGKRSVYRTRDRQVDYADVVRYFNRKKISIDDVIARRTGSATPEAVECFTPVLSPATPRAVGSFTPAPSNLGHGSQLAKGLTIAKPLKFQNVDFSI
ncbi:hypothetical protein ABVK25_001902 [Lepraria finkii]|uniref:Clr5 domain-containing protein n=1 Tax=Lepraria finkii TaxID=1340010 RepID=A0ABR4BNI3_9LECA